MQKTHQDTINKQAKVKISVLAPDLNLADNIGGLFRICDAMGVEAIYFGNEIDLHARKLKKAARSTSKYVKSYMNVDTGALITQYIENNHLVMGLELTSTSQSIQTLTVDAEKEVLLVIGNEIEGISEQLLSKIPQCYHIDMYGENSSMNVIQATSIALYCIQHSVI